MTDGEAKGRRAGGLWGWLFVAGVASAYAVMYILHPAVTETAWLSFVELIARVVPILAIVFVLIFVFNLFAEPKWIERYVGEHSGLRGWAVAMLSGVLSVGPIYPWYVLLGELRQKGMRASLIAVFLYSRAIKPPLVPFMIHYFGLAFTALLMIYIVAFAIIQGLVIGCLFDERN
jgi:uncharacterized membrane protein YraQ (UPF0718 family)